MLSMSPSRPRSDAGFFAATTHPYYICVTDYRQNFAGIRWLHYLCHMLNEAGYEAYIAPGRLTSPWLRAPTLTQEIAAGHFATGRTPIAVYSEVFSGNPLRAPVVARWLLNRPGLLGGDSEYDAAELLFTHSQWMLPTGWEAAELRLPPVDTRIFHNRDNPQDKERQGFCYYAHKYLASGGRIDPFLIEHGTSLCQDIVRSHEEIAALLRQSEYLYCYEESALIQEAVACGCPVIIKTSERWKRTRWPGRFPGTAEEDDSEALALIKSEVAQYPDYLAKQQSECWALFDHFVERTQQEAERVRAAPPLIDAVALEQHPALAWMSPLEQRASLSDVFDRILAPYYPAAPRLAAESATIPDFSLGENAWRANRRLLDSDGYLLAESTATWTAAPNFHLFVRLDGDQLPRLADTLEALNHQLYTHWHIDVLSTQAPPPGLEQVPRLGWQRLDHWDDAKATIDFLAVAGRRDWLLEIPAGAVLDPMCLWRIAAESQRQPNAPAFYVDDDRLGTLGLRKHLRLKPGANSEWLRSLDLAGPLFMSRQAWRMTGGAAIYRGSPWFDQLLRLQEQTELGPPVHVADALLSFADDWTSSDSDCRAALEAQQQRLGQPEDIIPLDNQAWRTLPRLDDYPPVSIVVVSDGQLEFLTNLLESLFAKTTYPAVELILMVPPGADPELDAWADALSREAEAGGQLQPLPRLPGETYLQSCHRGIEAASHELVLVLREDCHLLQETWLTDLVRTIYKPAVAAVAPRLVQPASGLIESIGQVAGLSGDCPSPYRHATPYTEHGYLGQIQVARDIGSASSACLLIDREAYRACGGFPLVARHAVEAEMDFAKALRDNGKRLLYQPQVSVVHYGAHLRTADPAASPSPARLDARIDPWWNPNLSLVSVTPVPEQEYHPAWQYLPVDLPRIVARPVPNAQGDYRVISPLKALRQAGKALDCLWPQRDEREFSAGELARLRPDSLIVQNYLLDPRLRGLAEWRAAGLDTFIVYALDDLFTEMPHSSSMRHGVPANARSRFRTALKYCDRLVVSTEFLAEAYRPLFPDIRVVPNRLAGEHWLNLQTRKRTGRKPRIGWAGGTTHGGDLELLTAIIEATRDEADWVFMGMNTNEIRPLLAEFHPGVGFEEYPRALAALDLDIAVAPLEQNRFNQGKSNLRLLEYGALGLPVVCTDIDPYRGNPACALPNDPARWIAALRERIHDADAREAEGEAMRRWVRRYFILEEHLDQWLAAHLPL
jgi:glycosyltransferase involved in cell wall biosynthesis